jgi:hypothetical protein
VGLCGGGEALAEADHTKAKGGGGLVNAAGRALDLAYHFRQNLKTPELSCQSPTADTHRKTFARSVAFVPKAFEEKDFARAKPLGAKRHGTDMGQME